VQRSGEEFKFAFTMFVVNPDISGALRGCNPAVGMIPTDVNAGLNRFESGLICGWVRATGFTAGGIVWIPPLKAREEFTIEIDAGLEIETAGAV